MQRPQHRLPANGLFQGLDELQLKIMFWNAGGLTNDKFTELKHLIIKGNFDIYCIVEAGAAADNLAFFQLRGYQTFSLKRSRQIACGIIVAAKSSLTVKFTVRKQMDNEDKLEAAELEIWKNNYYRRLFVAYNPPQNKPDLSWLEALWNSKCFLMGDLNAPSKRWGYRNTDGTGRLFEEFIDNNSILLVDNENKEPTFMSYSGYTSHPDVVLTHPSLSSSIFHTLLPSPDAFGHKILVTELKVNAVKNKETRQPRWNVKKGNWKQYAKCSDEMVTEELILGNVDVALHRINEAIFKCALKTVPRGQVKRYSPFWNSELEKLKEERDVARTNLENNNNQRNRLILKQKRAQFKRSVILSKRAKYKKFLESLDFRKDGVKAHRYISKLNNQSSTKNTPFSKGDKLITAEKDIAEYLCRHYAKISNFIPKKQNGKPQVKLYPTCLDKWEHHLFQENFSFEELESALLNLQKGKSAGPDEILPEFLIYLGYRAKKVILKFINSVWASDFPSNWRKAEIIPILKKNKAVDKPESYRPISLTSVFCKLYERMILYRLELYLNQMKIISENQAGFRRFRSTVEQVAHFTQEVKDGFQRKQSTMAVFIDFKNAFDRVWRDLLLQKLLQAGISGKLYRSLKLFLSQRFIRVKYINSRSSYKQTRQGLPQGSVLSPILFNLMINDIISTVESIPGTQALLYADDLIIWATSSSIKSLETHLNSVLKKVLVWENNNEMKVNPLKSEFQLFTLSTKNYDVKLSYDGIDIPRTNSAKYLGITMDIKLSWNQHIDSLVEKGQQRSQLIRRLTGIKWGASQDLLTTAYKTYMRPLIEYGMELAITASKSSLKKLDLIQNSALRVITGGAKSTPISAMEIQTGLEPLSIRREIAALSLYERLKRISNSYWSCYSHPTRRLKTQDSFMAATENLLRLYGIDFPDRQAFPNSCEVWSIATGYLSLISPLSKATSTEADLKWAAIETINERFPMSQWLHVYTDGSAEGANRNAGAGVYSSAFQIACPVGKNATNFDGELKAIKIALTQIKQRPEANVVIFVDSQSAILSVVRNAPTNSMEIVECRRMIHCLLERKCIVFQWVPSHCGIKGNEEADRLAKEGAAMTQPEPATSFQSAKKTIKLTILKKLRTIYESHAEGKKWKSLLDAQGTLPRDLPRAVGVACFRMLTGHDYLQRHLHRIGVVQEPLCPLCYIEDMDGPHLDTCPQLGDIRSNITTNDTSFRTSILYWAARYHMANIALVQA